MFVNLLVSYIGLSAEVIEMARALGQHWKIEEKWWILYEMDPRMRACQLSSELSLKVTRGDIPSMALRW